MLARLVVVLALLLLATPACGVPVQDGPQDLAVPAAEPRDTPQRGPVPVLVFLLCGDRLTAVPRPATDASPATVLKFLASGPTAAETEQGLRSALPPGFLDVPMPVRPSPSRPDVLDIGVTVQFLTVTQEDQLLATAQVVWTATESTTSRAVRLHVGDRAIDLPTDDGLSRAPVERTDFLSVAPAEPGSERGDLNHPAASGRERCRKD